MSDLTDRYARGELSPEEARALAQKSLDSPALFDELTDTALANAALNRDTVRAANVVRFPRRVAYVVAGAAAAAAALAWMLLPQRPSTSAINLTPALELSANPSQPVLLAGGLHASNAPVFRGDGGGSRAPQLTGQIVSMEDGLANLNLGSLDGLAKGSELQVFRGADAVGTLQVSTVFRDHARAGVVESKKIQAKDEVRVGGADHLNALVEQVDATFNRGDSDGSRKLAEEAVRWGEATSVSTGAMSAAWNQLAVLQMLRGEYKGAELLLSRAASAVSKTDPLYSQTRNNLGVLAELRGERGKAAANYNDALAASSGDQRQSVERNLSRVRGSR